ncbi:MAG: ion transporter [Terrimicrobiaceae bacterium]|nr:ion transporter [Terrimicrobiaceae bacterium]
MGEDDLMGLRNRPGVQPWRLKLATWVESKHVQSLIVGVIVLNAVVLGLETDAGLMERWGTFLVALDKACLAVFIVELTIKLVAYRWHFWKSGWNIFDFVVVAIALVPNAGPWAVLRSLRVLRVLRMLTVVPSLRKVVAAFLHAIPGLGGVMLLMIIFLYTSAVLATNLFGRDFPEWFGTLAGSLFSLFQILTLEGWADMARTIMKTYPWAAFFFLPFIVIATFTVLNLFIGIIVSTMQELALKPEETNIDPETRKILERIDGDLRALRARLEARE